MRVSIRPSRCMIAALPAVLGGCALDWTRVEDPPLVAASVTVVLTVDPVDTTVQSTDVLALLVREGLDERVTGALVRIVGESGRALRLAELPDTAEACTTAWDGLTAGTCYAASVPSARFEPLEEVSLRIATSDGGRLHGESLIPGLFAPRGLTAEDGRCRVNPETVHRIDWDFIGGAWAHIAEAEFAGLRRNLWDDPNPLHLSAAWMASYDVGPDMVFPRKLTEDDVPWDARKAARRLETGLPWGVTARLAVAAVDRNWANWIRPGQVNLAGEVPIPSVFGDGTGMFGTAVRWSVTLESRDAEDETGLVACGLQGVDRGNRPHLRTDGPRIPQPHRLEAGS